MSDSPSEQPVPSPENAESFEDQLRAYERIHARPSQGGQQIDGTVILISADSVYVDIGFKTEGMLPLAIFTDARHEVSVGDKLLVSVKGRNPEGYYELSRVRVEQPRDWEAMEKAFAEKAVISGTVTAAVKGGLTVDIGVRAFLPASRSGARDAADLEKLVGQEIRCRITKLDAATEDVVVDRRGVIEEEEGASREQRYSEVNAGDTLSGTVRSLTEYGAFIDLGGIDGLLHIGEISWGRVNRVEDVLAVGQAVEVKVIKVDPEAHRISLSTKQLLPAPWESVSERYQVGDRVRGTITRLTDFGAFLELEPGIEGMIHISEISWGKKIRTPGDMLKVGDTVEAMILGIAAGEHRLSLSLKQTLGDPWMEAAERFMAGSIVEGEIASFTPFGAFVQISEGVQGMVHISEIVADRRLNHPSDVLRVGERIKAKVLELSRERRQLRLSIKQMAPTGLEDFLAEHKVGDLATGRVVAVHGDEAEVELGEGIMATCTLADAPETLEQPSSEKAFDLSSMGSMLSAKWKSGAGAPMKKKAGLSPGQVRSFRITQQDRETRSIRLRLAD